MKKYFYPLVFLFMFTQTFAQTSAVSEAQVVLTSHEDHQRMLKLLGIDDLRPGPSGDPSAKNYANIDETKASPYKSLPDPLILNNGQRVKSAKIWDEFRREEIIEDFDREVYGRVPANTPNVNWAINSVGNSFIKNIPVIKKELLGEIDNSEYPQTSVEIKVTLVIPKEQTHPVPIMIHFGFDLSLFPNFDKSKLPPDFDKWKSQLLSKGWGYAIIIPTNYQDDNGAGLTSGIIGYCNKGQPRNLDDWGALKAWAWGASRAMDYLETDNDVNSEQVGIEGLSRYGKATLVTMAYDERFAIGFIGSSGAAGAKLHRRHYGEQVENIASEYAYHWMAGNYLKYAGPLTANDLPVDSHELISICAPRPVFIGVGSPEVEGHWIDARGMFLAAVHAGPVYELLEKEGLGTHEYPKMGEALIDGDIAFRQHFGGHTNSPNWETFLKFADKYFSIAK